MMSEITDGTYQRPVSSLVNRQNSEFYISSRFNDRNGSALADSIQEFSWTPLFMKRVELMSV